MKPAATKPETTKPAEKKTETGKPEIQKTQTKKAEESEPSTVKTIVVCLVLLAVLSGLGLIAGIFKNVSSIMDMLNAITFAKLVKIVIVIAYVVLIGTILKLCLKHYPLRSWAS